MFSKEISTLEIICFYSEYLCTEVKRIKNSYSLQGLKVVFIQTFKNKDTGIVTLDIFSARK